MTMTVPVILFVTGDECICVDVQNIPCLMPTFWFAIGRAMCNVELGCRAIGRDIYL